MTQLDFYKLSLEQQSYNLKVWIATQLKWRMLTQEEAENYDRLINIVYNKKENLTQIAFDLGYLNDEPFERSKYNV